MASYDLRLSYFFDYHEYLLEQEIEPSYTDYIHYPPPGSDAVLTLTPKRWYLLFAASVRGVGFGGQQATPTLTACGLTWVHLAGGYNFGTLGSGFFRVDIFAAVGNPLPGTVHLQYNLVEIAQGFIIVTEWQDTTRESATAPVIQSTAGGGAEPLLAPFADPNNLAIAFRANNFAQSEFLPGTGFEIITDESTGNNNAGAEYAVGLNSIEWAGPESSNAEASAALELGVRPGLGGPWLRWKQRDDIARAAGRGGNAPSSAQRGIRARHTGNNVYH